MASAFIHLHNHTEYSLLDGLPKIKDLIKRVKELDMPAVAITDHGALYGAIEFYKTATKEKIKPIIGLEAYVVNEDHRRKEGKSDRANYHLTLLAKNYQGYQNLMKLSTIAHLEGFYYRPRFDKGTLSKYCDGLICLSGCAHSEIVTLLANGEIQAATEVAKWYLENFGVGNYFLEIQRHKFKDFFSSVQSQPKILESLTKMQQVEDIWSQQIVNISQKLGIPIVATNDNHYLFDTDAVAQDALVCVSTGKTLSDIDRIRYVDTPVYYFKPADAMQSLFLDLPTAWQNTQLISDQIDLKIELGHWYFPQIEIPQNLTAPQFLRQIAHLRLNQKYSHPNQEILTRLDYELSVIIEKGYAPYFLMMADMVNWCTDHGIITNTRGSAAGSIVSYVLGITTVDPIRYELPFERFLNPQRPKPPDIDLDIADNRREELINYVTHKYGEDKVAQICTFGRMLARASVRDIGRVLGHPYSFPDKIAKLIPLGSQGFPMTIKSALDISPELRAMYESDDKARQLLDLAQQIEGNARHASVHAAGLVVSPGPMTDYTPLQLEPNGSKIITQYEMHACEDVGLVKFDILGIRHLSILGAARDLVKTTRSIELDLNKLPLDDEKTFNMLSRGETMGVFQLGGAGMTRWLTELRPNRVEDIMVMIALFRPGPMANIPEFIARKNGRSPVTYLHPKMEKFLKKSYGILVYQEDVLFTALELAGYDWNTVDALRQAIGKKKPKEMAEQHDIFIKGCQEKSNIPPHLAEKIWELFVPFQGYGFNKAHAASYGLVSYQTAYLKANFPVEYMTALLTAESGHTDKVVDAVNECKRMGILVLPPNINTSQTQFTIETNQNSLDQRAIRFGLSAIKNVGDAAISAILSARNSGPFTSLSDFCQRVDNQKVNRKVLESLIKSGCMDEFGNRSSMLASLDRVREKGQTLNKIKQMGQSSLFGDQAQSLPTERLDQMEEYPSEKKLEMEKELLGFYLTDNPYTQKLTQAEKFTTHKISQIYQEKINSSMVTVCGVIESIRTTLTKSTNQQMCFAKVSDTVKSLEVVVFPKVYQATKDVWKEDNIVIVQGRVELNSSGDIFDEQENPLEVTLIATTAAVYQGKDTALPVSSPAKVSIFIPKGTSQSTMVKLNALLQAHKGNQPAEIVIADNGAARFIPLAFNINWDASLQSEIDKILKLG